MTRRWFRAGLVIFVAYVAMVSATIALRDGHVRPLYDGFAPGIRYSWVAPPEVLELGNVKPTAMSETITLDADGSAATGIATPDGQFVISLGRGAVAPTAGATQIAVRITPLDPRKLAPVPGRGLRAIGNAYHLEITYEPGGQTVTRLAKPGSLLLELPDVANHEFVSADGKNWSSNPAKLLLPKRRSMSSTLRVPGYYVAATDGPTLAFRARQSSHASLVIGLVVVLVALFLFLWVYLAKTNAKPGPKGKQKQKPKQKAR